MGWNVAATTHDYTKRGWGHDYVIHSVIRDGQELRMSGWGRGIRAGDFLLLENEGSSTRYRVESISYHRDPSDMWAAAAVFAPRSAPPKESADKGEVVLASCAAVALLASVVMSLGVAWAAL